MVKRACEAHRGIGWCNNHDSHRRSRYAIAWKPLFGASIKMVMTKLFTIPVDKARDTQIEVWKADDHLVIGTVHGDTLGDIPAFLRKGRRAEASETGEAAVLPAFDSELEALQEADWISANLVDVHREAIRRAASLDDTLTYVTDKCAAVGKP